MLWEEEGRAARRKRRRKRTRVGGDERSWSWRWRWRKTRIGGSKELVAYEDEHARERNMVVGVEGVVVCRKRRNDEAEEEGEEGESTRRTRRKVLVELKLQLRSDEVGEERSRKTTTTMKMDAEVEGESCCCWRSTVEEELARAKTRRRKKEEEPSKGKESSSSVRREEDEEVEKDGRLGRKRLVCCFLRDGGRGLGEGPLVYDFSMGREVKRGKGVQPREEEGPKG